MPICFFYKSSLWKWAHLTFEATNPKGKKNTKAPAPRRRMTCVQWISTKSEWKTLSRNDLQIPVGIMSQHSLGSNLIKELKFSLVTPGSMCFFKQKRWNVKTSLLSFDVSRRPCTKLLTNKRYSFSDHSHLWDTQFGIFLSHLNFPYKILPWETPENHRQNLGSFQVEIQIELWSSLCALSLKVFCVEMFVGS